MAGGGAREGILHSVNTYLESQSVENGEKEPEGQRGFVGFVCPETVGTCSDAKTAELVQDDRCKKNHGQFRQGDIMHRILGSDCQYSP